MLTEQKSDPAAGPSTRRVVLIVEGNADYVDALQQVWAQVGLLDELKVVGRWEEALETLRSLTASGGPDSVAGVVVDPELTGEETGEFLRELRRAAGPRSLPVVLWTRVTSTFEVLAGTSVLDIVAKPLIMPVIHALDAACHLRQARLSPRRLVGALRRTPTRV